MPSSTNFLRNEFYENLQASFTYATKANMLLYFNYVATLHSINLQFEDESVENLEISMGMIDLCIALNNYARHFAQSSTVLH